ncbi:MAG TPA: hypothetical protein VGG60_01985 [Candidatus Binataceae bacterium]|jgi:hypothetical protein
MRIQPYIAANAIRVFVAIGVVILLGTSAHAGTWYLMAADLKIVSNPSVASRLYQGSRLGPLQLTSQGEFSSREECEPARKNLVSAWRKHSPTTRGGWDKFGITSASAFIRCVPDTDPHLTKSPAAEGSKATPSMEIVLRVRPGR